MTSSESLLCDIGNTLEHEPELHYFLWKVGVEDCASRHATIVEPTGLLTDILTDSEWSALPMNRTRSPGGTTTVAPRPIPQVHVPITMGMTNAQISVAKYANDRHLIWHDAQTTFKSALIRSLGPTLEGAIGPPPDGFKMISPSQILAEVKLRYGTVDQVAFEKMEDILAACPTGQYPKFGETHCDAKEAYIDANRSRIPD